MNISCPACGAIYRIDPDKVPGDGVRTRCRECDAAFALTVDQEEMIPGGIRPGVLIPPDTQASEGAMALQPEVAVETAAAVRAHGAVDAGDTVHSDDTIETGDAVDTDVAGEADAGETTESGEEAPPPQPRGVVFGTQDPEVRARQLARALVSDIKVYHRARWEESRARGSLRKDFRDEILKSWDDYVEQVGETMAKRTPYFRDALNDILAGGEPLF